MILRKALPLFTSFIFLASLIVPSVFADTVAVIGTGQVAQALGPKFAAQGHLVIYGSREPKRPDAAKLVDRTGHGAIVMLPADAVAQANIIVLAVPGLMVEEIVRGLGSLAGKIIIDPTNPLRQDSDVILNRTVFGKTSSHENLRQWVYRQTRAGEPAPMLASHYIPGT